MLPAFLALLDVAIDDEAWTRLDPPLRIPTQLGRQDLLPSAAARRLGGHERRRATRGPARQDASLAPLKRLLIERTEGNPFFLEESVCTLVEQPTLDGAPGSYRLS